MTTNKKIVSFFERLVGLDELRGHVLSNNNEYFYSITFELRFILLLLKLGRLSNKCSNKLNINQIVFLVKDI